MLITYSIVSHGQGYMIKDLLEDFLKIQELDFEIILTLNIPEDESFYKNFKTLRLTVIRNASPKGFGANHNAAFAVSEGEIFTVVNPDIRLSHFSIKPCIDALYHGKTGACAPVVLSKLGTIEDNVRFYPTLIRLIKRRISRQRKADYIWQKDPIWVDWAAGMFIVFRREAFIQVKGFNERYFMYLEDADICRRLKRQGWQTVLQPATSVIHDAQRASHRNIEHLKWHIASIFTFLLFS